jgi:sugar O-acyltransferase (sialic acid O-acetyltransferase NeuD family)
MKDVVIFGLGELAQLAYYYLKNDSAYNVVGFTVDEQYRKQDTWLGLPVANFESVEDVYSPEETGMFVALGYNQLNKSRKQKCQAAKAKGFSLVSYLSSRAAICPNAKIGENCMIMENVTVQPFVTIGDGVILCNGAQIAHHTAIGDYCFIAASAVVGGLTAVAACCFVGMNATIRDKISVGEASLIGAGAIVLEDAPAGSAYLVEATPRALGGSRIAKNFL